MKNTRQKLTKTIKALKIRQSELNSALMKCRSKIREVSLNIALIDAKSADFRRVETIHALCTMHRELDESQFVKEAYCLFGGKKIAADVIEIDSEKVIIPANRTLRRFHFANMGMIRPNKIRVTL